MKGVCKKKCYFKGSIYKPGDTITLTDPTDYELKFFEAFFENKTKVTPKAKPKKDEKKK